MPPNRGNKLFKNNGILITQQNLFIISINFYFLFVSIITLLFKQSEAMLDVSWWSSVAQLSSQINLQQQLDELKQQNNQNDYYYQENNKHYSKQRQLTLSPQIPSVTTTECTELKGLSPGQKRICELFKDHMPAVGNGAKQAISECEWQFRHHRWNCSTPRELKGHIGPVHKRGTREAAFTYAIMSAGVTHEIGRRCRLGMLKSCGCAATESKPQKENIINDDWTWGGCGDNIDYGYRFSRDFVDVREKEESIKRDAEGHGRSLMNRWNNEVGRKILKRHTKPKCKCHGVSGSCNIKTCWMQLPSIRQIGNILQSKYHTARRIQINSRGNMQFEDSILPQTILTQQQFNNNNNNNLNLIDYSPDYCQDDQIDGTIGTTGRICSIDPNAPNSCDILCCNRGYQSHIEEVISKCNCKFQWCCQVVCETCRNLTEVFTCK
ncbi:Protein Wnt [Meloidogyne graminicola]|uniref:Protein Wnt n=1 Tax=Meloidogyne graminicola TaxID=189291 RepID=A0A8S9ZWJ2_9BILA|nr:Protein Wnt [Meloidogyne graminicola]